jgi:hypothetical protein
MRLSFIVVVAGTAALGACAGQATQQQNPQDPYSSCATIRAEMQTNKVRIEELAKGGQSSELATLQSRQQYLAAVADVRCGRPDPPPPPKKK